MKKLLTILTLALATAAYAQVPTPGAELDGPVVLVGGNLHVGNGTVITNAAIGMENGLITFVMDANQLNDNSGRVIDVSGKEVYPGFILPNNILGIFEIGAVRATRDYDEVGSFNPNVRSVIAYNTDSKVTPTVRSNGILMSQVTPRGGRISGTSSIVQLDAWNWEDAIVHEDDGIHFNWPARSHRSGWWGEPGEVKQNEKHNQQVDELREFMLRAKAYAEQPETDVNLKMQACTGLFKGEKRMYIHVNGARNITQAVQFAVEIGAKNPVIVGGKESWLVTDLLKQHRIPVILTRVHSLPQHADSDIDEPFKVAHLLQEAGVLFCFNYQGDMEVMGARNLPFAAGTAVAYGLSYENAISALTLNTAAILGCADVCGSVEKGKQATLFVSDGDALDMRTNNVVHAFIQGREVDLDNHQKQLFKKYMAKYE